MPGDTVFRRFAALPRAIVAHLIAAEPLYRSVFMPRQTWFRSYQKCCRGAGGRRKALLLACRRWPTPFPPILSPSTAPGSKFGSCETPTMPCFPPHQTWFRSYQKCCRGAIPASCQPDTTPQAGGSRFGSCKTGFSRA